MDNELIEMRVALLREFGALKLEPLKQWFCDKCGEVIDSADKGWLEWLDEVNGKKRFKFRIVHHNVACMYNENELYKKGFLVKDMHLEHFVGPDGLNHLLDIMLDPSVEITEVAEIIKRTQVPFYEESLLYRVQAVDEGFISGDSKRYCNVEDNLDLIKHYARK